MGLYDASFLNAHTADVVALTNVRNATAIRWKQRGMGWEDKLFKVCDAMGRSDGARTPRCAGRRASAPLPSSTRPWCTCTVRTARRGRRNASRARPMSSHLRLIGLAIAH